MTMHDHTDGTRSAGRRASRASLATCASTIVGAVAILAFQAIPAWQRAESNGSESGRLLARTAQFESLVRERDAVQAELAKRRMLADQVLREIPSDPEQASVMRMFAVHRGEDIGAQTIVAGDALPATQTESGFKAVPVTIDMTATYARVMEVLSRAEGARRLVRPIRIEISRPLEHPRRDVGIPESNDAFVEARIELDAVFGSAMPKELVP